MNLSRTERWILSNQYLILEALYPEEADHFAKVREALESGYAAAIDNFAEYVYDDHHSLDYEGCRLVVDILDMFWALQRSFEEHGSVDGVEQRRLRFPGFDGNNEGVHLGYARFVVEKENRFASLDRTNDMNSHMPSLETYGRMLEAWDTTDRSHSLSEQQVRDILEARIHPTNR